MDREIKIPIHTKMRAEAKAQTVFPSHFLLANISFFVPKTQKVVDPRGAPVKILSFSCPFR